MTCTLWHFVYIKCNCSIKQWTLPSFSFRYAHGKSFFFENWFLAAKSWDFDNSVVIWGSERKKELFFYFLCIWMCCFVLQPLLDFWTVAMLVTWASDWSVLHLTLHGAKQMWENSQWKEICVITVTLSLCVSICFLFGVTVTYSSFSQLTFLLPLRGGQRCFSPLIPVSYLLSCFSACLVLLFFLLGNFSTNGACSWLFVQKILNIFCCS